MLAPMSPRWAALLSVAATLLVCTLGLWVWLATRPETMPPRPGYIRVDFAAIAGWQADDQGAAWPAFLRSCRKIAAADPEEPLAAICRLALAQPERLDAAAARAFFERHFTPHAVAGGEAGFLTGYYEPVVQGARRRDARFTVPLYARPDDLVLRASDVERASRNDEITGFRLTPEAELPYWTRAEIEDGALAGRGLEILYLDDPVEAFLMQVQGSGVVQLADGDVVRLAYAGKNGHPYTSIGRLLVERGEMTREAMSLESLKAWLRSHPERGRALMRENRSFIFFRELTQEEADDGPLGAQGVALTPGRSLAVDGSIHRLGLPVWVVAPSLDVHGEAGFARLMIAQDVGSAIRGAQRGDIFWGTGEAAGHIAGRTRHAGRFLVLLPRERRP